VSIPQSFIQELLSRTDLVEVVGRYVQLKKGGANFMGLCPFHGEKSPSFSVSPAKQFYHCFGCGANGNAISFLMEHAGMGFVEAVKELAQQAGLPVPEDDASPQDRARAQQQREQQVSLTEVLEQAARAYQKQLKTTPRAVAYLKGRGLSGDIAKTFGLGYAPEGWRALASLLPDYTDPRLVESGLVIASEATETDGNPGAGAPGATREGKRYDRFRDRIMFPIRNVKGETIGFGGRVLDKGEPKYLNSPETPVFSKGRELYGLYEGRTAIRVNGYALVTEGYMDVVALAQLGFANAVATLGTACTAEHVQKLFRFTDAVIFSFDGDSAGRRAAGKAMVAALPFAQDTRSIKFLFLPPEHDPDSFIRANGQEAFAQCVKEAMPLSRFMQETAAAGCDLATAEGRAMMASHARPLWQALPDGALKRQMLGELAQHIGLGTAELTDVWQLSGTQPHRPSAVGSTHDRGWADSGYGEPPDPHSRPWSDPDAPTGGRVSRRGDWKSRYNGRKGFNDTGHAAPRGPRTTPMSRADLVARTLLSHPEAWDWLTPEDHHLLAGQPEPLGLLFAWLEGQWHEHGAQPWAVLQQAMAGQAFAGLANRLVTQALSLATPQTGDESDQTDDDLQRDLREMLNRMLIEDLKQRETLAIAQAASEPSALQTYRDLQARRLELERLVQPAKV
jgi:DNA primase